MAGRRPLNPHEERAFLNTARRSSPRDQALLTAGLFLGFRSFEVLSLTIGQVWRDDAVLPRVGLPPRHRKGRRGETHWLPVVPELQRALERYLRRREKREGPLPANAPLFVSRTLRADGTRRAIGRKQSYRLAMRAFRAAGVTNDGRLGTHTFRKTFAQKAYALSGHSLLVTRDALGHRSAATTEKYLEVTREAVDDVILRGDWTRGPRHRAVA